MSLSKSSIPLQLCPTTAPPKVLPNLLPCRPQFNGRIPISTRHWNPHHPPVTKKPVDGRVESTTNSGTTRPPLVQAKVDQQDEQNTPGQRLDVHFRGRLLQGYEVNIPEGYTGHVLQPILHDKCAAAGNEALTESDAKVQPKPEGLRTIGTFSSIVLWDHDHAPDPTDELYKGQRADQPAPTMSQSQLHTQAVSVPDARDKKPTEGDENEVNKGPTASQEQDDKDHNLGKEKETDDKNDKARTKALLERQAKLAESEYARAISEQLGLASLVHQY